MPKEPNPNTTWSGRFREPLNRTFEQWQRNSQPKVLCMLLTAALALSARAQDGPSNIQPPATVTFYVHGSRLKSGVPGTNTGIFYGAIYDGTKQLFPFHQGFTIARNDRFATLTMPPGPHDFAAWYGKHPTSGHHLAVMLEPGKQYFFRAQSESRGIIEVEIEHGRLDLVTCQTAHQDAPEAKPVQVKHPSPDFTSILEPLQSMPPCVVTNPNP